MVNKLVLSIDFDGVIHDHKHPIAGRKMGAPIEGSKSYLELFRAQGHKIIVHSVRGDGGNVISDWMKYYQIPYDEITNIKPQADFYIDDRAIRFTDWKDVSSKLST